MIDFILYNQSIRSVRLSIFLLIIGFISIHNVTLSGATSLQQTDLPDSCNVDFMTQMTNRATAEAARDTAMAQTALRKADSVLEYSCFSQFANLAATTTAPLFTETKHWDNKNISNTRPSSKQSNVNVSAYQPSGTVSDAIQNVVLDALEGYISDNFEHDYLAINGLNINHNEKANYDCSVMQIVWHMSKCDSFHSEDIFTKLGDQGDIRQYPQACNNKKIVDINVQSPPDPVITQLRRMNRNAPNVQSCSEQTPIATGRMVQKIKSVSSPILGIGSRETLDSAEKICLLPGCYYDYITNKCAE